MKKIIFLVCLLSLSFSIQIYSQVKNSFGFKGGISIPNYRIPATSDMKIVPSNVIGFRGGVFLDIGISKSFDIQTELDFLTKPANFIINRYFQGMQLSTSNGGTITKYVTYSVKPKFKMSFSKMVPYFSAGPMLNIYCGYNIYDIYFPQSYKDLEGDNFKSLYMGVTLSLGCEFVKILPFTMIAELSFSPDLDVIYSDSQSKQTAKTYGIDFVIGCKF